MKTDEKIGERLAFSVEEVAVMLGLSVRNVYTQIKSGVIKSVRVGDRVLVPRYAVDDLLAVRNQISIKQEGDNNG